jgi:hypothetical protein
MYGRADGMPSSLQSMVVCTENMLKRIYIRQQCGSNIRDKQHFELSLFCVRSTASYAGSEAKKCVKSPGDRPFVPFVEVELFHCWVLIRMSQLREHTLNGGIEGYRPRRSTSSPQDHGVTWSGPLHEFLSRNLTSSCCRNKFHPPLTHLEVSLADLQLLPGQL